MIVTWSRGEPDDYMPEALLTDLAGLVRRHPWWAARSQLVLAILERHNLKPPARVLDAGCGWGVTLEALEQFGYRGTGLDVSRRSLERLDRFDRRLIEADLSRLLDSGTVGLTAFDAVLALDLIEHLDDDRGALGNLGQLVRPGGIVIITVPALPELYSEFDQVQGHRRRYLPDGLRVAIESAGLEVETISWWGSWLVRLFRKRPPAMSGPGALSPQETYRRHLRLPPWPIPAAFRLAFRWDQGRTLAGRNQTGTSLVAVARRPLKFRGPTDKPDGAYEASRKYAMTPSRI
jgi:SAM-dependent methyltransferase